MNLTDDFMIAVEHLEYIFSIAKFPPFNITYGVDTQGNVRGLHVELLGELTKRQLFIRPLKVRNIPVYYSTNFPEPPPPPDRIYHFV